MYCNNYLYKYVQDLAASGYLYYDELDSRQREEWSKRDKDKKDIKAKVGLKIQFTQQDYLNFLILKVEVLSGTKKPRMWKEMTWMNVSCLTIKFLKTNSSKFILHSLFTQFCVKRYIYINLFL